MTTNNKQKQGFAPIILILAIVVALGLGGYYLSKQNKTSSVIPAVDKTADWKTYTNTKYGFEFKYPNLTNWQVKEAGNYVSIYNYDVDNAPGREFDPVANRGNFKIEINKDDKFSDVTKWFEQYKKQLGPNDTYPVIQNTKTIEINGNKGIYYEEVGRITTGAVIIQNQNGNLIHFYGGLDYFANKNYFDQILSTFKFTQ